MTMSLRERLLSKMAAAHPQTGCVEWTDEPCDKGYGRIMLAGKARYAHRVVYEEMVGPIPEGLDLDHLCRNRRGVRPDHLEPVSRRENIRRGEVGITNRSKTSCPQGHPYAGENLLLTPRPEGGQHRACRACRRAQDAERKRAKRRAAVV